MTTNMAGQFGDTTYTKVFVGGLAWETQKETMKKYFEQFGEILEAVVITDKNTGRSKGYGFVTFRDPESAMRACVDPSPVIDGRRANCNLASLGVQRSRPTTPQHGGRGSFRVMKGFQGGIATAFPSPVTFPHYAIQQGVPYNVYGYSPYSTDYSYPMAYYNLYGGGAAQYPLFGGAAAGTGMVSTGTNAFYPYFQFGHGQTAGYGMQYPQLFQYSAMGSTAAITGFAGQQYGVAPVSLAPSTPAQVSGMTMALPAPSLPATAATHYRLIPPQFSTAAIREQPLALNHG
ncbi:Glycine-rich RNA-binding protein [Apostasia shenzhenica]|uniref:Glycine-rich RNA-binding protein n=1 Tax=Apostasia shenzhenica TaxID=1088818 RepID=A0A2I0ANM0_9ASPA|nr:Glycine-rich RNA-binding protein [Apostasia shenzhenica]